MFVPVLFLEFIDSIDEKCGRLLDASLTGDDSIAAARHNTSPPYTHEIARSDSTEITQMLINPMGEIFI